MEDEVGRNDSLSTLLARHGVSALEVDKLVAALDGLLDATKCRVGDSVQVVLTDDSKIRRFRYQASRVDIFVAVRDEPADRLIGYREHVPIVRRIELVEGTLEDSLYLAMEAIGETPWLTLTLADIFAWDIDFFTEPRRGDRFRLLVEKNFVDGQLASYERVLAAEYAQTDGGCVFSVSLRVRGRAGGVLSRGRNRGREDVPEVSREVREHQSRYGIRKHPILKYVRAHKGVDYGAPRGTAVWAVGDGVVTAAGHRGGYGRLVSVRHRNGLETRYAHLNGYASAIRPGARVHQKQVLGYVGSSGLATGPHLHFEVLRGGRHMNPLSLVVPPAPPIDGDELSRFRDQVAPVGALVLGRAAHRGASLCGSRPSARAVSHTGTCRGHGIRSSTPPTLSP
ncbi:MAG: M23 family metallopeptidase [Myxococcales bacterium]|nr:M23 family metallopeptidase [Myxococcales bacterium]